jgi:xanthine dehydrogenase YagS FAD-binding subunit
MRSFQHYQARSLKEAASLLAKHQGRAKVNAGGTDLLGCLRDECLPVYPEAVIDIKKIPGLETIKASNRGLKIGALTRLVEVARSPIIQQEYPLLAQTVDVIASPNIRNMATVGGNLAQEIRCWYFRYAQHIGGPITCLRKGGRICNAVAGDNRYHSIFGAAPEKACFAVHPSDLAVALVALNAIIVTNARSIAASEFFHSNRANTTVLEPEELIKEIQIPKAPKGARQTYSKFTLRKPIDFAVVSVASVITEKKGVCSDASIVLGAVGPSPIRATAIEEFLKGKILNETIADQAAQLAFIHARPLSMNAYKIQIGKTLVKRALLGLQAS